MKKKLCLLQIAGMMFLLNCGNDPVQIVQHEPVIHSVSVSRTIVYVEEYVDVNVNVNDEDKDELFFTWTCTSGSFTNAQNASTQWKAPTTPDTAYLTIEITDGTFTVSDQMKVVVRKR